MKGTPDAPRCGFSNTIVQILREHGIEFDYYDILGDEEVSQIVLSPVTQIIIPVR